MKGKDFKVFSKRSFAGGIVQVDYDKVPPNAVYDMLNYHINIDGTLTKAVQDSAFTTSYQTTGWKSVKGLFHDGTALYVVDGENNRILYTSDDGSTWQIFKSFGAYTPRWHYLSPFYRNLDFGDFSYFRSRVGLNGNTYDLVVDLVHGFITSNIVKDYKIIDSDNSISGARGIRNDIVTYIWWGMESGSPTLKYNDATNGYSFSITIGPKIQSAAGYYDGTNKWIVMIWQDYSTTYYRGKVLKVYVDSETSSWTYKDLGTFTFVGDSDLTAFDVVVGNYDSANNAIPFYIAGYKYNGDDEDLVIEVFKIDTTSDSVTWHSEIKGFEESAQYSSFNDWDRIGYDGSYVYFYSYYKDKIYKIDLSTASLSKTITNFDTVDINDIAIGYANQKVLQVIDSNVREIDESGNSNILMFNQHTYRGTDFTFSSSKIFNSAIGAIITGDYTPYIRGNGFISPLIFDNWAASSTVGDTYFVIPKIVIKRGDLELALYGLGVTNGGRRLYYYDLIPLPTDSDTEIYLYGEVYEKNADGDYVLAYRQTLIPGIDTNVTVSVSNGETLTLNGIFPPNDNPPEYAVIGTYFKGRLILAKGNRIYWSGINWRFDNTYYWLDVGTSDIVALVPFRNALYIFTEDNRIFELTGDFPVWGVNYGVSSTSLLNLREVTSVYGNIKPDSIVATLEGIYFLTDTNLWLFNGFSATPLIKLGNNFIDSTYAGMQVTKDGYLIVMTGTDYTYVLNETLKALEKHQHYNGSAYVYIGRTVYATGFGKLLGVNRNNVRELYEILSEDTSGKALQPSAYVEFPWMGDDRGIEKTVRLIHVESGTGNIYVEVDGAWVNGGVPIPQSSAIETVKVNLKGNEFLFKIQGFDTITEVWISYTQRAWRRRGDYPTS